MSCSDPRSPSPVAAPPLATHSRTIVLPRYKAGQYCELLIPAVSKSEWHPFTIASSPKDKYLEFYIQVRGGGGRACVSARVCASAADMVSCHHEGLGFTQQAAGNWTDSVVALAAEAADRARSTGRTMSTIGEFANFGAVCALEVSG